ncbi:MAG TPA: glycosyltransferase family 4 protein [Hyphomonas sp.]|nr:glycosyltransferase family 4 protein [Hyphomonas sp.]
MEPLPDMTGKTILQVAPELSAGGVERTVLEVTEAIVEAGGRALLASRGGRLEAEFERLGGELFRMDAKSKNPVVLKANEAKLKRIIHGEGVHLVHARSRAPAWSAYGAAKAAGVPFLTTYHGAYSGHSGLKLKYNSVMAKGELVIANSQWIAQHVHDVHHVPWERIVTIPRGVDLAAFDPVMVKPSRIDAVRARWGLKDGKQITLFLPGRLTEWKGQLLAIEAMALLAPEEREGLVLVLAGDAQGRSTYEARIDDTIRQRGLDGKVIVVGHEEDMPAAYLASDIVLAPSTRPEAFGRVAPEASAMGRPVIVSDHGGGRETVLDGETGARVEPGDPAALAGAIRALLAVGATARAGMGKAGQTHIRQHFSKRGLQMATLGVYKRLIG